jgi:hypothetical protein
MLAHDARAQANAAISAGETSCRIRAGTGFNVFMGD